MLLVHRPRYDDWSLPKGKLDPGEHPLVCAVREVAEETGHRVVLGRPLPLQRYLVEGRAKVVQYWAARADDEAGEWAGTPEIDRHRWVPTWQAPGVLTHPRDAEIVRVLTDGPPATVPLVVLRHAEALPRKTWRRPDGERPLSAEGDASATRLADLLGAVGIQRVVTSDAARCVDTVAPYAGKAGLDVELAPEVSEEVHERRPEAAGQVVAALVADGLPTVLCSHRPVLPALRSSLERLAWGGTEVPAAPLRTSELLAAHHTRGVVVSVELHGLQVP